MGSTIRERQYLYNEQLVCVSVQFPLIKNTKSTSEVWESWLSSTTKVTRQWNTETRYK